MSEDEPPAGGGALALSSAGGVSFLGAGGLLAVSDDESHLGVESSAGGFEASAGGFDGPHASIAHAPRAEAIERKTERGTCPRMPLVYHAAAERA